jgi:hypothetical protein
MLRNAAYDNVVAIFKLNFISSLKFQVTFMPHFK